ACENYAPIPGRETRDMGRHDYQTLERSTRLVAYDGGNWLERQNNVKVIEQGGARTQLAREEGKNWYVRLPEQDGAPARAFARPHLAFWELLRATWDEVFTGAEPFVEKAPAPGQPPRYTRMQELEARFAGRDLADATVRAQARAGILAIIEEYRA